MIDAELVRVRYNEQRTGKQCGFNSNDKLEYI